MNKSILSASQMIQFAIFSLILGVWSFSMAQGVMQGKETQLYSPTISIGSNAALNTKHTTFSHFGTAFGFVLDGPPCPLKVNSSTISLLLSNYDGMDQYNGPMSDPLRTRGWGRYNQNATKYFDNPPVAEWSSNALFTYTAPLYKNNDKKLTSANVPPAIWKDPPPLATWSKTAWIVGIHKVTASEAAAAAKAAGNSFIKTGDLLGITHIEARPLGWSAGGNDGKNTLTDFNTKYSLGISYSKAVDGGKKWTYYGEVIKQHADTFDDVYLTRGNIFPDTTPGFKIHNISGGIFLVINDFLYVYFDEYTRLSTGLLEPRMAVARASITNVLKDIAKVAPGNLTNSYWKKYSGNGAWSGNTLTGVGVNILDYPVAQYFQTDTAAFFCAGFSTHNSAVDCNVSGKHLYLMTLNCNGNLILFSSKNGLSWDSRQTIYSAPPGCYSQYSCFVSLSSDASDDCHVVGKQFSVIYPTFDSSGLTGFFTRQITVKPDNSPIVNLLHNN